MFNSEIVRIERGTDTFGPPSTHPSGHGFLYRLTSGQLDNDNCNEVLADVSDLNYKNLNKFIEDLAWEMAKGGKTEFSLSPPLNPVPASAPDDSSSGSPISNILPQVSMMLSSPALQSVIPQAEFVSGMLNMMNRQMPDTTTKAGAPPLNKMNVMSHYGSYHPWYSDYINEELISYTEKTLLPDGANYPDVAGPLVEGKLKRFDWNGSDGYSMKESMMRVGVFSLDTVIDMDKQIVVKGIEGQH
ncbi:MAG: hypothetical protein ABH870_00510, partial [bacterium]